MSFGRFVGLIPFKRLIPSPIIEKMTTPQARQNSAPAADNEVELQSQPMDLAHKSSPVITTAGTATARVIGEGAKSIFLVRSLPFYRAITLIFRFQIMP